MLKNNRFIVLLISSVFLTTLAQAEQNTSSVLLEKLKSTGSFISHYQQKVLNQKKELIETSEGVFYLGKNKAFRNDILTPSESRVISDGENIWLIDDELEQVSVNHLNNYLKDSPLALILEHSPKVLEGYKIKPSEGKNSGNTFFMQSKDAYSNIESVMLQFKGQYLRRLEITEQSGRIIQIDFTKYKTLVSDKHFEVKFDKSYEVVDER